MKTTKMRYRHFVAVTAGLLVVWTVRPGMGQEAPATELAAPDSSSQQPQAQHAQPHDVTSMPATDSFDRRARSLFDGETLIGWRGDGSWFHVNDGSIVAGRLDGKIPTNQFLMTREAFGDFDLRLDVRLVGPADGPHGNNAGVQFRSRRPKATEDLPATEMVGYQADMGAAWDRNIWGALYDESRRRKMLAEPDPPVDVVWSRPTDSAAGPAETGDQVTATPWMAMRILCVGPRIQIFIDDRMTVDYTETDSDIARQGHIALQIHSGEPCEAWYRNIRILML